jgi:hypothetical protein
MIRSQCLTAALFITSVLGAPSFAADQVAIVRPPAEGKATPYRFTPEDERFLDEIQRACFQYFWKEVGSPACLVKDRMKAPVSSIAAVGFQLSSLPIGVERGWITRKEGEERARTVLTALLDGKNNRKWGVFIHFPDHNTADMSFVGYEISPSTVDTALFIAGAIPAAEYFGGPVKEMTDRIIREANWKAFATGTEGFLAMSWVPADGKTMASEGSLNKYDWHDASDEERLIYLLAVGSPVAEHAVDPKVYAKLHRTVKSHGDMPPYVVSWPGALFTYLFSHCWIDYRALAVDDPSRFGQNGPKVDWFENSRRAVLTHRQRCREQAERFATLTGDVWGLSACDGKTGYIVPSVQPNISNSEEWHEGTVAPYAAGTAIMLTPQESLAALRAMRALKAADGKPLVWRDPSEGGYGFADAFNIDQGFVSDDYIGIDHGPMLLAIENARTGLVWRLFMKNEMVQESFRRLRLNK